jgi:thiamine pyrophosphate-dependent acetolactate synthase large subunit-like protein
MATKRKATLERRDVVARILRDRGDALVIGGLGSCAWDITAAGDVAENFPLWGAMGGTVMIGLGLALAQPKRRVLAITGDGDMLMGLGSLATAGAEQVRNLSVIVIDNEHYGETGMQPTHTGRGVDMTAIARGCGFTHCTTVWGEPQLKTLIPALYRKPGPVFADIKVIAKSIPNCLPARDGTYLKHRMREAVLGRAAYE